MKHGPRTILLKLLTILLSGSPYQWWTRQQQTAGPIPQQSLLRKSTSRVQLLSRATSALTVELVGINQFQMFVTVNIKKFPRGIRIRSLAESCFTSDGGSISMAARAPGPSFKPQVSWSMHALTNRSHKLQAPSLT